MAMSSTDWTAGQSGPPPPPTPPPPPARSAPGQSLASQLWSGGGPSVGVIGRSLVFVVLGAAVTSLLCLGMHSLIKFREASMTEDSGFKNANFIRLKEDTSVSRRTRELPKKQKKQKQPSTPTLAVQASKSRKLSVDALKIDIPDAPAFKGKVSLMGTGGLAKGTVVRDRGRMPLAFIKPIYPPDARDRGIEGYVDLVITVTKNGSVKNPRVVKAQPPSVFNRAAMECVKKWRYQPEVVEGRAVEVPNVKARVTFKLNNN